MGLTIDLSLLLPLQLTGLSVPMVVGSGAEAPVGLF